MQKKHYLCSLKETRMDNRNQNNQTIPNNQNNQNIQNDQNNQSIPNTPSIQSIQITPSTQNTQNPHLFLPQHGHYRQLRVYQVAEALYDLTFLFCQRFLSHHGDRTVDQMVQAARSGKQNIAEGNQAAATSSETEIKLTNVARASLEELLADYEDYLRTRSLPQWGQRHPRLNAMRQWTKSNDFLQNYKTRSSRMNDEEMANLGITLCHQAIYMLGQLLKTMQERFTTEGGIKERMHAARTGYRQQQDAQFTALQSENAALRLRIKQLEEELKTLKAQNNQNNQNIPSTQTIQSIPSTPNTQTP